MPEAAAPAAQTYVVEPGDTLASIASRFGVSAEDLRLANAIEDVEDLIADLEQAFAQLDSAAGASGS